MLMIAMDNLKLLFEYQYHFQKSSNQEMSLNVKGLKTPIPHSLYYRVIKLSKTGCREIEVALKAPFESLMHKYHSCISDSA